MTIWNPPWTVVCRRNERSKEGWWNRWQWGDPAGCLSSAVLLDVDLSLKGASPGKALWHWQHVYTPGQCWSVLRTHSTFLLRSYISSCWLWCAWTALILSLRCASTCSDCLLQLTGSAPSCCFWLGNRMATVPPGFPSDQPAAMGPV